MPLPTPNEGESRSDFMDRCVDQAVGDGMERGEAVAACEGQYDDGQRAAAAGGDPVPSDLAGDVARGFANNSGDAAGCQCASCAPTADVDPGGGL